MRIYLAYNVLPHFSPRSYVVADLAFDVPGGTGILVVGALYPQTVPAESHSVGVNMAYVFKTVLCSFLLYCYWSCSMLPKQFSTHILFFVSYHPRRGSAFVTSTLLDQRGANALSQLNIRRTAIL